MRKFGIEIEAGLKPGARLTDVSAALRAAGLGGDSHGYQGHSTTQWVVKTDGSVPGGIEVVSPPLDFDDADARAQVNTAIAAMSPHCQTSTQAGIHVHVESAGFTPEQLSNLVRTWTRFEDVIFRIATSGWNTMRAGARNYARPLGQDQVQRLVRAKQDGALRTAYYGRQVPGRPHHSDSARYYGLNLHSHFYRGTVEFRIFNSSLNASRVQTYVAMCVALMEDAKSGRKRSVGKAARLGDMAAGRVDPAKVFFQFLSVMRYQAGMSLEDYRGLKKVWKDSKAQQPFGSAW